MSVYTNKLRKAAYWIPHYASRAVEKFLRNKLASSYGMADRPGRRALAETMRQAQRIFSLASEANSGSAHILCGCEVNSGQPLSVALVGVWETGQRNTLPYFQHMLFGDSPVDRQFQGSFPLWQIRQRAETLAQSVDMVMVITNNMLTWQPMTGDWACGPAELRMVLDFPPGADWEQIERSMTGQKENIRRLKRAGYSYTISRSDEDFTRFYNSFYVPTVKGRYQDYGDINTEAGLRYLLHETALLIFIQNGEGETVSAGLEDINYGVKFGLLAGVLGGSRDLVKKGALSSLYYFSIKHAFESGCHRHDAGVCLPFTSDGVHQHKRMWGFRPLPNLWRPRSQLIWAPRSAPAAVDWLKAHPFVPELAAWGGRNMREVYEAT